MTVEVYALKSKIARGCTGDFVRLGAKDSNLYWLIQSQQSCH